MAERGRNRTFYNRFAIDSSSCVLRHGRGSISCEQNLHGRFQANRLAAFVKSNFAIPSVGRHLSPNQGLARGQIAPQRRLVGHVTMSIHQRYLLGWLRPLGSCPRAAGWSAATSCLGPTRTCRSQHECPVLKIPDSPGSSAALDEHGERRQ